MIIKINFINNKNIDPEVEVTQTSVDPVKATLSTSG